MSSSWSDRFSSRTSCTSRNSGWSRVARLRPRTCHLCGVDGGPLRHLDDAYLCEGRQERYDKMLKECFGITVAERKMICHSCVRRLRSANDFRSLINKQIKSHDDQITLNSGSRVQEKKLNRNDGITHICNLIKAGSLPSKPDHNLLDLLRVALETQLKSKEPKKQNSIRSQKVCSASKQASSAGDRKIPTRDLSAPKKRIIKRDIKCSKCKETVSIVSPIHTDLNVHDFLCKKCKTKSKNTCICKKCNVIMPIGSLEEHMALHARAINRQSISFNQENNFTTKRSSSINHGSGLAKRSSPIRHRRLPKRFHCPYCQKNFSLTQSLANHMNLVHGDLQNCVCLVCGKVLGSADMLERHMRVHNGELFQCSVCLKNMKTKKALQLHEQKNH